MGDPVRLGAAQSTWLLVAVAALVVGIVAWWSPRAGADTSLGTTGETANNFLFDEATQPGAACVLDPETQTVTFTVTAPYIFGLDREPGITESTSVSWKAHLLQDGTRTQSSVRQLGSTSEFGGGTFTPIEVESPALPGLLSIQVEIAWIDFPEMANETVLGTSLRQVDFYSQNLNDDTGARTVEDGCRVAADEPTPVPTDTPMPTSTPIPPTATNTPAATATNTPEPTATNTPAPPATSTPEPTATNTPTPTTTNTPEPTATNTPAPTATNTPSPTPTPSPTATFAPTPTVTTTPQPTATQTPLPTVTPTPNPTGTPTPEPTATTPPNPSPAPNGPAAITTNSSRGIVNSNLRITLSGFPANSYTEITFSGATVAALTTTAEGTAASRSRSPPSRPARTRLWAVSGTESVPRRAIRSLPG